MLYWIQFIGLILFISIIALIISYKSILSLLLHFELILLLIIFLYAVGAVVFGNLTYLGLIFTLLILGGLEISLATLICVL